MANLILTASLSDLPAILILRFHDIETFTARGVYNS